MVIETVTWRMRAPSYRDPVAAPRAAPAACARRLWQLGGARHYREPSLARVHALGAHGPPPVLGQSAEAQVAEHAPAVELMHAFAGKRSSPALGAGCVRPGERADAAAHEHGGEIGHGKGFGFRQRTPAIGK